MITDLTYCYYFLLQNVEDLVNENALLREQLEIMEEAGVCYFAETVKGIPCGINCGVLEFGINIRTQEPDWMETMHAPSHTGRTAL